MRSFKTSCLAIVLLLLAGCIVRFPLYTEKDLIEVPHLTGSWQYARVRENRPSPIWTLAKGEGKEYHLILEEERRAEFYIAQFLKLEGQLFMDLQIADERFQKRANGHVIAKVSTDSALLKVILFDGEYLVKETQAKRLSLAIESETDHSSDYNMGTTYFIAEPTEKLQKLIGKYKDDPKVFSEEMAIVLTRK